jgi:non-ribosomal peptide synthetase-like protein
VSILDLYNYPSVRQLAHKFLSAAYSNKAKPQHQPREKYSAPFRNYFLCGVGQFFGCVFQYALGAWQLLAVILGYAWVSSQYSLISLEYQVAFLALFLSMPFLSMLITVAMKWLLLGRVKPGVYPLWGWFYYRWWLVQRLQRNVYLGKHLAGSPLITIYYRLLGATIGTNCHIGTTHIYTPDLLTMGDHVSIGKDSKLNGYIVEDGWLKIGPIDIGNQCFIGSRSVLSLNTRMHHKAVLDDMSMIADGTKLEEQTYYTGSPAKSAPLPQNHLVQQKITFKPASLVDKTLFGMLHFLGIVFVMVMVMYYLCILPSISLISFVYGSYGYLCTMFLAIPAGAVIFLSLYYLSVIGCKKILMDKTKPGFYPLDLLHNLSKAQNYKFLQSN